MSNEGHPRYDFGEDELQELEEGSDRFCPECKVGFLIWNETYECEVFYWCTRCDYIQE